MKLTFDEPEPGVTIVKLVHSDVPEEDRLVFLIKWLTSFLLLQVSISVSVVLLANLFISWFEIDMGTQL